MSAVTPITAIIQSQVSKEIPTSEYVNKLTDDSVENVQNDSITTSNINLITDDEINKRKCTDSEIELIDEYIHLSKKRQQLKKSKEQNSELVEQNDNKKISENIPIQPLSQESSCSSQAITDGDYFMPDIIPIKDSSKTCKSEKVRKIKNLPEHATAIMRKWFEDHIDNPYPTEQDRIEMAKKGQLAENQVKAWFANKRNRSDQKGKYTNAGKSRRKQNFKSGKTTPNSLTSQINHIENQIISNQSFVEYYPSSIVDKEDSTSINDLPVAVDNRKLDASNEKVIASTQPQKQRQISRTKKLLPIQPRPNPQQLQSHQPLILNKHSELQYMTNINPPMQLNQENLIMCQINNQAQNFQHQQQQQNQSPAQQKLQQKIKYQQNQQFHLQFQQFHHQMEQQQINSPKITWEQQQQQSQQYYYNNCFHQKQNQQNQSNFRTFTDLNNCFNPVHSPSIIQQQILHQDPGVESMLPFGNIPTPVSAHSASSLTSTFNFNEPIVHNYQPKEQVLPVQPCFSNNHSIIQSPYQKHLIQQQEQQNQFMDNNFFILGTPLASNQPTNMGYLNYANFQDYNFSSDPTNMMQQPSSCTMNSIIAAPLHIPINLNSNQYQCDTPPPIITKKTQIPEETSSSNISLISGSEPTMISQQQNQNQQQPWLGHSIGNNNSEVNLTESFSSISKNKINLSITSNNLNIPIQSVNTDQRNSYCSNNNNRNINNNSIGNSDGSFINCRSSISTSNLVSEEQLNRVEMVPSLNIVNIHPNCLENYNKTINNKEVKTKPKNTDFNNNHIETSANSSVFYMDGPQTIHPAFYTYQSNPGYSYNSENSNSFQSIANNYNDRITRNSEFQKYITAPSISNAKCVVEPNTQKQLQQHDATRFTDDKNREWCVSHHPRLSSTLLKINLPSSQQFNN